MTMSLTNVQQKTRRSVLVVPGISNQQDVAIDEDDYLVICELVMRSGTPKHRVEPTVREIVEREETGDEQRVIKLQCSYNLQIRSLPVSVGRLDGLVCLKLLYSEITSLPPSIGRLKKLQELVLAGIKLKHLPNEIGNLVSLKSLCIFNTKIAFLPPSIALLRKLENLDIGRTETIPKVPDEIWELVGLVKLRLSSTAISPLPPSIGKLQNLKSLEVLKLRSTSIVSLPPSIGNLQKLKILDLFDTQQLSRLPEEIGNLDNLEALFLAYSGVNSLPNSIARLKKLLILDLYATCLTDANDDYLLMLVRSCKSLFSFGSDVGVKVCYALSCNRARFRIGHGIEDERSIQTRLCLWPYILHTAARAFGHFKDEAFSEYHNFWLKRQYKMTHRIHKPEAIFRFLDDAREQFIRHIIHRNSMVAGMGP